MKKIIDGKTYNTETVKLPGVYRTPGLMPDDYFFCREELYRTKKGTYFLYGKGGAMTSYFREIQGMAVGGDAIQIITEDKAKEWAEHKLSANEYAEIFGEAEER